MPPTFRPEERRAIAGSALTIFERSHSRPGPESAENPERPDEILETWRETLEGRRQFDERLDRDDLTESNLRNRIESSTLPSDASLPDWFDTLETIATELQRRSPAEYQGMDSDSIPFVEFFTAVADITSERLPERRQDLIADDAFESMERWLRDRFVGTFTRVLYVEFKTFVASHDLELAFADPEDVPEHPRDRYEEFIEDLFGDGFVDLCLDYPMFGRFLATMTDQWVSAMTEFRRHLESDLSAIAETFDDGDDPGTVVDLIGRTDDTHHGGKMVLQVRFESNLEVLYKPRNVDAGVAFYDLLERLQPHLDVPGFSSPTYLPRDGHGWMELITSEPCETVDGVSRYYRRAGSLLCLTYLLGFNDCHFENLIANGEHPVLVDCETILHAPMSLAKRPLDEPKFTFVENTVLRVGLLPWRSATAGRESEGREQDYRAGFGVDASTQSIVEYEKPVIEATNTDVMAVEFEAPEVELGDNVPALDGDPRDPATHVDDLLDGFRTTYETIESLYERDRLLSDVGFLAAFEGVETRFVFRGSRRYRTMVTSIPAAALEDGAAFTPIMERLATAFFNDLVHDDRSWPLYEAERVALKRLEPPRFLVRADDTTLRFDGSALDVPIDSTGIDAARERLEAMGEADLRRQLRIIERCYGTEERVDRSSPPPADTEDAIPLEDARLREEATSLLERVRRSGIELDRGGHGWVSVVEEPDEQTIFLNSVEESLYTGRTGIALASAAAYQCTGDPDFESFAMATIAPKRRALTDDRLGPDDVRLGGTVGVSSDAYAVAVLGSLLDRPELIDDARRSVDLLTDQPIEADTTYDVAGGSSGTILGLLGIYDRCGSDAVLDTAVRCGDHLLSERVRATTGERVWNTGPSDRPLTGFLHGTAGIAYSLCRLGQTAGAKRFIDAGNEALDYQANRYSAEHANWPDDRPETGSEFVDQWCHGRSGIGLSRVGIRIHTEHLVRDRVLSDAFDALEGSELSPVDHLCCGNAGRVEFLLEAGRTLDHGDVAAREYASRTVGRAESTGDYVVRGHSRQLPNPTLYLGLSGIAYTLFRVTSPEDLPCLLRWE